VGEGRSLPRSSEPTAPPEAGPPIGGWPALFGPPELVASLLRAAASEAPILILGEAGTGRTSVARELHRASGRAAGPLVEVDPGSIPASLFESELFGHRPGAFTGAAGSSPGRVERARGGTLLLDRIEALPLAVQPKLLRLLAERRFTPLGGREREADVRFIAIAAEDLPERMAGGSFREDLYYRLEVLAFRLPPLRERQPGELGRIIEALLADLAGRFARPEVALAPDAWEWMVHYPWPGNLRQLRNLLERALILGGEDGLLRPPRPAAPGDGPGVEPPRSLAELEAEALRRALAHTRGHQGRAAEILGISRKTLWEKRRRHGIP